MKYDNYIVVAKNNFFFLIDLKTQLTSSNVINFFDLVKNCVQALLCF